MIEMIIQADFVRLFQDNKKKNFTWLWGEQSKEILEYIESIFSYLESEIVVI